MTPKNYPKSFRELARRSATEEACCQYLFELRWPEGFRCPGCQGTQAWRTGRGLWLCGTCHGQISVTAGTIFHGTRVPLHAWFRAAWELAGQEKGATVSGVMRLLRLGCGRLGSYETAWTCVHKLRRCLDALMSRSKDRAFHHGALFRCLLQQALKTPPQPSSKSAARTDRQVEPRR